MQPPEQDDFKHFFTICGIIGTALVWCSIWFLVEIAFKGMSKVYQIFGHLAILLIGLKLLHTVSHGGVNI